MDAERPGGLSHYDRTPAARLRAAGLRSTRPRRTVLEALHHLGGHRSADELVQVLSDQGVALPRSTVFAVLDDLSDAQLVDRVAVGEGAVRYELAAVEPHHHFVCDRCGRVDDVAAELVDQRLGDLTSLGITVTRLDVTVRGVCASCTTGAPPDGALRPD